MPSHLPPLHLILTGPGRIGAGLEPLLRADGHTVRILTRADYGDFADPAFDPHPTVDTLPADPAPDAILHLAGLFQIGPAADPDRLLRANAHGPIALAEALHARFPHAQHILFLDARVAHDPADDPAPLRPYLAAKRALTDWVFRTALAWGRAAGPRVNAIAPRPPLAPPPTPPTPKARPKPTPPPPPTHTPPHRPQTQTQPPPNPLTGR